MTDPQLSREEAERQLVAAAARHREAVAALAQEGRSDTGDTIADAVLGRGTALVAYALRRAQSAGIGVERLAQVSGWAPDAVADVLDRDAEPLGRVLPLGTDPAAASLAAATLDVIARIEDLLRRVAADVLDPAWTPTPEALDQLHAQLERDWLTWRRAQQRGV